MGHNGHHVFKSNLGAAMNTVLSPIDEAASYDRWFRAKVQKSLDNPLPNIPHDQVMAEMRQMLEAKRKKQDVG